MNENDFSNKMQKIRELFETGMATGEIFMYELDQLMKQHKDKFENEIDYRKNEIMTRHMASQTLEALMQSGINPHLWSDFLMMLSRYCELMFSEGKRIAEKHHKENNND